MNGLALDTSFTPLGEALPLLEDAVSPICGIATHVSTSLCAEDECGLPNATCGIASTTRVLGRPSDANGAGEHPDGKRARAAAIGEAIERYSALFVPPGRLVRTSAGKLEGRAVAPDRFALFHSAQHATPGFPFRPFTEDAELLFVEGMSLADRHAAFVPAELVFMDSPRDDDMQPIGYATSSGLACAPTFAEAVLRALLELVERDAVMIAWKGRLSLPLLDWEGDPALAELAERYFTPTGFRYCVLDGSAFSGIPVAIGVLRGEPGSDAGLAVGAGCSQRFADAWLKALAECFSVQRWLAAETVLRRDEPPPEPDDVRSFDSHMFFYATEERARDTRFLDSSTARTPLAGATLDGETPREQIAEIVARLARRGVTAYAVDVTAPDVRELGLSVARVLTPELCALDVPHPARYLGGARLYEAPASAGLAPRRLELSDVNDLPHPFP